MFVLFLVYWCDRFNLTSCACFVQIKPQQWQDCRRQSLCMAAAWHDAFHSKAATIAQTDKWWSDQRTTCRWSRVLELLSSRATTSITQERLGALGAVAGPDQALIMCGFIGENYAIKNNVDSDSSLNSLNTNKNIYLHVLHY